MISISTLAAKQIMRLQSEGESPTEGQFLRIKVVQGGCSGMSYKLDFANEHDENDRLFEEHGTKVVVDAKSLLYIAGMTLDYEGGLNGKGFVFSNPNAAKTCGCGISFKI
jgi:iron-sulfur cluster assembly protein